MKILAIILIISSLTKLAVGLGKGDPSETFGDCSKFDQIPMDPEKILAIVKGLVITDGLVGLFCGAFIFLT